MKFEILEEAEIKDDNITSKIIDGDLDYIKNYFKKNPKHITYKLNYDQDLLSFSIYANQKQIFDWLLANGAKIVSNKNGFTAMHQSIYNSDTYYLKELIKFGGDINKKTKKTPAPIVLLLKEIMERNYTEVTYLPIFKELIKCGADLSVDLNGENIFIKIVKYGIDVSFVKAMVDADNALLKEKVKNYNGNHNMLDISILNFNGDLVVYFMEQGLEITDNDIIGRFITNTSHTDAAMKVYNTLSDKFKESIKIEEMLYVDNGKKKMFALLEKGIKIFPSFIKNQRVIAIADELLKTDRAVELNILGAEHNIEEFMAQDVKDIFLF